MSTSKLAGNHARIEDQWYGSLDTFIRKAREPYESHEYEYDWSLIHEYEFEYFHEVAFVLWISNAMNVHDYQLKNPWTHEYESRMQ